MRCKRCHKEFPHRTGTYCGGCQVEPKSCVKCEPLRAEVERLRARVVELERLTGWLGAIADARKAELERYNGISALKGRWVPMKQEGGA